MQEVTLSHRPKCDLGCGGPAFFDAKTRQGPWGYLCQAAFAKFGVGLGVGKGQRIIIGE